MANYTLRIDKSWLWKSLSIIAGAFFYFPAVANAASITPAYQSDLQINKISGSLFDSTTPSRITQMAFGPDARLYAITDNQGVSSFAYDSNTGTLSDKKTVANISGLGIGFQGSTMYLSAFDKLVRLTDDNNNGVWGEFGETSVNLVEGIPTGDHSADQIQIQGNTLYLGIGIRTINGEFTKLFSQPLDSKGETSYGGSISWIQDLTQVPSTPNAAQLRDENGNLLSDLDFITNGTPYTSQALDKLIVHSSGARNPYGIAFDADGNLWMTSNYSRSDSNGNGTSTFHPNDSLDADFSNDVYDQFFKVSPKADYGYANGNWRNNPEAEAAGFFNPNNLVKSTTFDNLYTTSFSVYDPSNPDGLGPSASANGFDFYKGNELPSQYQNKAFITRFNKGPLVETDGDYSLTYGDVVLVDPRTGDVKQIADGFENPLAILADSEGVLIADWNDGIYRISASSTKPVPEPSNFMGLLVAVAFGVVVKRKAGLQKTIDISKIQSR
jgi:glucose/arabinose dehydrogenase